jgi:hypothetical protein
MITKDFPSVKEKHRIRCFSFVIMPGGGAPIPTTTAAGLTLTDNSKKRGAPQAPGSDAAGVGSGIACRAGTTAALPGARH